MALPSGGECEEGMPQPSIHMRAHFCLTIVGGEVESLGALIGGVVWFESFFGEKVTNCLCVRSQVCAF